MIIRAQRRRVFTLLLFHCAAWSATAYFAHSAYTGDRGVLAKIETKAKIDAITMEINQTKQEHGRWQQRVNQLSGKTIDRDLLDERQRALLNLVHKNDVVFILPSH